MLDARGRLLRAALGFVTRGAAPQHPALHALHLWLDSWRGVGAIAAGMAHQDLDLQLTRYAERGWRANFYPSGLAHSVVKGTGWATEPWWAVVRTGGPGRRRRPSRPTRRTTPS
jgi:hypothetical protein